MHPKTCSKCHELNVYSKKNDECYRCQDVRRLGFVEHKCLHCDETVKIPKYKNPCKHLTDWKKCCSIKCFQEYQIWKKNLPTGNWSYMFTLF